MKSLFRSYLPAVIATAFCLCTACKREPVLHLHRDALLELKLSAQLKLQAVWQYDFGYDYTKDWHYGWDEADLSIFGPMGYPDFRGFDMRQYYLGYYPGQAHTSVRQYQSDNEFITISCDEGYHDLLAWNKLQTQQGVQSIVFTETLDEVSAQTRRNVMLRDNTYPGTKDNYNYNQPEALFCNYTRDFEISGNPQEYSWDEENHCWFKKVEMELQPVTYIYLTQIILHNNKGRIDGIDGSCSLSAMSKGVSLNTCITMNDAITVDYYSRLKREISLGDEKVDIIGGRVMTFGICNTNPSKVTKAEELGTAHRHYMDVNMVFNNGLDSTLVFDVTNQVRRLYKGGVITIDLDVDKIKIPDRPGGSGFDAVVKAPDDEQYEFEI